jgi:N-acetylneuraminate synthase
MGNIHNFLSPFKKNASCKAFIIAEAGVHHACDINMAKRLIEAAADAGADAIKFQTYKADSLVTRWAPQYWSAQNKNDKTQYECFSKRDRFEFKDYKILNEHAKNKNILFCSTPFDSQAVRWLNDLDVPFWKVASGDIDNFILLAEIAKTNKPILLSTGASFFREITHSIEFLRSKGVKDLALLHCNLAYPTPDEEANLRRISDLKKQFPETLIGYSDHTIPDSGVTIPVAAAALGAEVIEKHFTLDRQAREDDHYHSVDSEMLACMIKRIALVEKATQLDTELTESEMPARKNARRSLVAAQTIERGTVITKSMIIPKRPGDGISPSKMDEILGRTASKTIKEDTQILLSSLEV